MVDATADTVVTVEAVDSAGECVDDVVSNELLVVVVVFNGTPCVVMVLFPTPVSFTASVDIAGVVTLVIGILSLVVVLISP